MKNLFIVLFIAASLNAQSVHKYHNDLYSTDESIITKSEVKTESEILYMNKSNASLNKVVFGYLPSWEYLLGNHQYIRWDLITHLAVFPFVADGEGNISNPTGLPWPWYDVIEKAIEKNVKIILTVVNFNPDENKLLLTDNGRRQKLFDNISTKLLQNGLQGVNIDFENINDDLKMYAVKNFMRLLKEHFNNLSKDWEISFSSPSVGYNLWDFKGISDYCDFLMIMGYDFYGSWSSTTGPSAPLNGQYFSITKTIENEYKDVDPQKIVLGVPYYGNRWKTKANVPYAPVKPYDEKASVNDWQAHVFYREVESVFPPHQKMWDNGSRTSWLYWKENDTTYQQAWYDDSNSLALKYDLINQKNLKGAGIWALGYDGNRAELWNLIAQKFTTSTSVENNVESLPLDYALIQNYPNPFNPETKIKYSIPSVGREDFSTNHVTLKVYDMLGREIQKLVNEEKAPGNYEVSFNGSGLASGIYFYRLNAGNFSQTKKMILTK